MRRPYAQPQFLPKSAWLPLKFSAPAGMGKSLSALWTPHPMISCDYPSDSSHHSTEVDVIFQTSMPVRHSTGMLDKAKGRHLQPARRPARQQPAARAPAYVLPARERTRESGIAAPTCSLRQMCGESIKENSRSTARCVRTIAAGCSPWVCQSCSAQRTCCCIRRCINYEEMQTCGVLVKLVEAVPDGRLQVVAAQPPQPQPRRRHRFALLPHVFALALPQRPQEVLEGAVPLVLPATAQPVSWQPRKVECASCTRLAARVH